MASRNTKLALGVGALPTRHQAKSAMSTTRIVSDEKSAKPLQGKSVLVPKRPEIRGLRVIKQGYPLVSPSVGAIDLANLRPESDLGSNDL